MIEAQFDEISEASQRAPGHERLAPPLRRRPPSACAPCAAPGAILARRDEIWLTGPGRIATASWSGSRVPDREATVAVPPRLDAATEPRRRARRVSMRSGGTERRPRPRRPGDVQEGGQAGPRATPELLNRLGAERPIMLPSAWNAASDGMASSRTTCVGMTATRESARAAVDVDDRHRVFHAFYASSVSRTSGVAPRGSSRSRSARPGAPTRA